MGTGSTHTRAPRSKKGRSRYMRGSKRLDSVGEELNANGLFTSYKRKRTTKKKSSRAERTKCCRTDFGASLSLLASAECEPPIT